MEGEFKDGENITYSNKHIGNTELFPLSLKFCPNGRHFAVLSDKDFVISTSGIYRDSFAGACSDLAWSLTGDVAYKDGSSIKYLKLNTKEELSFKPGYPFDSLFGGAYLGTKNQDSLCFFDFETQTFIRKIDESINNVVWNDNKKLVALVSEDVTYILKCNDKSIEDYIEDVINNEKEYEDGCESAFESVHVIKDNIVSGIWHEDVFIFITNKNKLNYLIENEVFPITTLSGNYALLGYYQNHNRIYFMSKSFQLISVTFPISFVHYQCKILKKDLEGADKVSIQMLITIIN